VTKEHQFEFISTIFFIIALFHTFSAGFISKMAKKFPEGSVLENTLHLFGEVEIVFGFWSGIWIISSMFLMDFEFVMHYLNGRDFSEAIFIFVIMAVCSTRPLLIFCENVILGVAKGIPIDQQVASYFAILFFGPLLGSFVTEPAAMTISAFLLLPKFFTHQHSIKFKYATLGLLFVNVSVGGTLTPFAAPPVLMVAGKWGWDLHYMLTHFAPKSLLAVFLNTALLSFLFRKDITKIPFSKPNEDLKKTPLWVLAIHLFFLGAIVVTGHYVILFVGLFLFFMGFLRATFEFQKQLNLKDPLMVGFFLGGLIVLGGGQSWWLESLIGRLNQYQLFFGAIGLTAITDNAALTFLASQVSSLTIESRFFVVAGSVIGGGLTLIANAPNPAGYGILGGTFEKTGFSALHLFRWALVPTLITTLIYLI
jgi:Na+/H+ antiporter NhaD/arsenite permease-like protein